MIKINPKYIDKLNKALYNYICKEMKKNEFKRFNAKGN